MAPDSFDSHGKNFFIFNFRLRDRATRSGTQIFVISNPVDLFVKLTAGNGAIDHEL